MEGQKPTIGRVVHYLPTGREKPCAAIIVDVEPAEVEPLSGEELCPETVDLFVIGSNASGFTQRVCYSPEYKAEHWSWPPRV